MLGALARQVGRAGGAAATVSVSISVPTWIRVVSNTAGFGAREWRAGGDNDRWAVSRSGGFHTSSSCLAKPGRIKVNALLQPQHFEELGIVKPGDVEIKKRTGLLAIKCGMTREWNEHGVAVPLTVLWIDDCQVVQQKLDDAPRGVFGLQLGAGSKKPKQLSNALKGHFEKAGVPIKREVAEFRVSEDALLPVGTILNASHFVAGQFVDIQGYTIGKGFQGPMKRWGFRGLPASHGTTKKHRAHGSIGNSQDPGRVWKGKKMAGRMGGRKRTVQSVFVYKVDPSRNLLYVKGQVPGKAGLFLKVKDALRKPPPYVGVASQDGTIEGFKPGVSGLTPSLPYWATGAAAEVSHAAAPYPTWGVGNVPPAPTETTTAQMLDPFVYRGGGGAKAE